jgi:hypothetical protein
MVHEMQYSFFIVGLISMLTGTYLHASALIAICIAAFIIGIIAFIAIGWSALWAVAGAFGLVFTIQLFYIIGLLLVYGKDRLAERFLDISDDEDNLPRRAGKTPV